MFTGIVEARVPVLRFDAVGKGARMVVAVPAGEWDAAPGDSIATSGCCLTVADLIEADAKPSDRVATLQAGPAMAFDLSAETLEVTWLGRLQPGRFVNLERAARLSDRLGGHMVSGHVDGVGRVTRIDRRGDGGAEMHFEVPADLERYLISKGSVTLDGVSLTVVQPEGPRFRVALIPETLARTTLGQIEVGEPVHVEVDMIGKWIERLLEARK